MGFDFSNFEALHTLHKIYISTLQNYNLALLPEVKPAEIKNRKTVAVTLIRVLRDMLSHFISS
jgi:hypothetical protein